MALDINFKPWKTIERTGTVGQFPPSLVSLLATKFLLQIYMELTESLLAKILPNHYKSYKSTQSSRNLSKVKTNHYCNILTKLGKLYNPGGMYVKRLSFEFSFNLVFRVLSTLSVPSRCERTPVLSGHVISHIWGYRVICHKVGKQGRITWLLVESKL